MKTNFEAMRERVTLAWVSARRGQEDYMNFRWCLRLYPTGGIEKFFISTERKKRKKAECVKREAKQFHMRARGWRRPAAACAYSQHYRGRNACIIQQDKEPPVISPSAPMKFARQSKQKKLELGNFNRRCRHLHLPGLRVRAQKVPPADIGIHKVKVKKKGETLTCRCRLFLFKCEGSIIKAALETSTPPDW